MKLKQNPITTKKANTGSTKLPVPIATQLYWKRKMTNSTIPVLKTPPLAIYTAARANSSLRGRFVITTARTSKSALQFLILMACNTAEFEQNDFRMELSHCTIALSRSQFEPRLGS
jgi:hypothetical protein